MAETYLAQGSGSSHSILDLALDAHGKVPVGEFPGEVSNSILDRVDRALLLLHSQVGLVSLRLRLLVRLIN
jgi:hypothetical protein